MGPTGVVSFGQAETGVLVVVAAFSAAAVSTASATFASLVASLAIAFVVWLPCAVFWERMAVLVTLL